MCEAGLLYADHTVRFPDGKSKLVKKPDWSPDTMLSTNYMEGPVAIRQDLLPNHADEIFAAPDARYALLLEISERTQSIRHIAENLCSGAADAPCKSFGPIKSAIHRRRLHATVERGTLPGSFALRYAVPLNTRVSVIIYGNGSVHTFRKTLESVAVQSCWPHMELIIADSGGIETEKERYYAALQQNHAATIVRLSAGTGTANALNNAAAGASGEALLFLPAGARILSYDSIERMLEYALLPHVGAVGGVCVQRKEKITGIIHNTGALDDGPMMTMRNCYFTSGGFDETFAEAGFIRAYTLLHADRRLYNVLTPYAQFEIEKSTQTEKLSEINKQRIKDMRCFETRNRDAYFNG